MFQGFSKGWNKVAIIELLVGCDSGGMPIPMPHGKADGSEVGIY